MSPEYRTAEPRQRLEYGAVPLLPWQAKYPGDDENRSYFEASRLHLEEKNNEAFESKQHLIGDLSIKAFMLESLLATHTNRIDYNHDSFDVLNNLEEECAALRYAYDGLATPSELTDILATHPEIKALEIAKLSHPFDFDASEGMDIAVMAMLDEKQALTVGSPTRYKIKRRNQDIPAAIVVRKTELGNIAVDAGVIRITQRQSLLVRGDVASPGDIALPRIVKNEPREDELIQRIESHMSGDKHLKNPFSQFVQPATTSYYAKYLKVK